MIVVVVVGMVVVVDVNVVVVTTSVVVVLVSGGTDVDAGVPATGAEQAATMIRTRTGDVRRMGRR